MYQETYAAPPFAQFSLHSFAAGIHSYSESAVTSKLSHLFDMDTLADQRDSSSSFGSPAPPDASSVSKPWKPKKPPKYKGRFYPVIGGKEGNCLYKKKKHAIKQMKGLPNASMKAWPTND
eukprot:jgi/Tetstr1/465847/TSEL_010467.t1